MPLSVATARGVRSRIDLSLQRLERVQEVLSESDRLTKGRISRSLSLSTTALKSLNRALTRTGNHPRLVEIREDVVKLCDRFGTLIAQQCRFNGSGMQILKELREVEADIIDRLQGVRKEVNRYVCRTRIVTHKVVEPNPIIDDFIEKMGERGWRISREEEVTEEELIDVDPWWMDSQVVEFLRNEPRDLLKGNVQLGLIRYPIVLVEGFRIPHDILSECEGTKSGYTAHMIFGHYLVFQDAYLLGIHQSGVSIEGRRHRITPGDRRLGTDPSQFSELVKRLKQTVAGATEMLNQMVPVFPGRSVKRHYYYPLLPKTAVGHPNFDIGAWGFLT